MATTLAEKLASSEKLSIAGTDAFPLLATPSGTPSPGMTRFNTLGAAFAKGTIPFAAGNLATSQPFAVTQTWTNAAVAYVGMQLSITDTASAVGSLLMDVRVGGSSRFSVRKDGRVILPTAFLQDQSGGQLSISDLAYISTGGLQLIGSAQALSFGAVLAVPDTFLLRDAAANVLAQRNGTAGQTLRIYNTYTDASNYERAEIAWAANVLQIGPVALGTGALRQTLIRGTPISFAFGATPTVAWNITAAGHFHAQTDNLYDIGATATTLRPRNLFMAGTGYFGSTLQMVGVIGLGLAPNNAAWLAVAASTTARANLNLAATGVAPSAPANGDIWFDGAALKIQIAGVTKTVTVT
jgi:hypothetical protein